MVTNRLQASVQTVKYSCALSWAQGKPIACTLMSSHHIAAAGLASSVYCAAERCCDQCCSRSRSMCQPHWVCARGAALQRHLLAGLPGASPSHRATASIARVLWEAAKCNCHTPHVLTSQVHLPAQVLHPDVSLPPTGASIMLWDEQWGSSRGQQPANSQ